MKNSDKLHVTEYYNLRRKYFGNIPNISEQELEINQALFYKERKILLDSLTIEQVTDIRDTATSWHCKALCTYLERRTINENN